MNFYLLDAAADAQQQAGGMSMFMSLGMLALMFLLMYFLIIRPQKKK